MQRVTAGDPVGVDHRLQAAVEAFQGADEVWGVERAFEIRQGGVVALIEEVRIAPQQSPSVAGELGIEAEIFIRGRAPGVQPIADISAEQLVGAFSRQHYFETVVPHQAGKSERASIVALLQGGFGMPDGLAQSGLDGIAVEQGGVMNRADARGHQFLLAALVDLAVGEADGEGVPLPLQTALPVVLPDQSGDQGGVQATAQIEADIDIGLKSASDRRGQSGIERLVVGLRVRIEVAGARIIQVPIRTGDRFVPFKDEQMAGRQAADIREEAARAHGAGEGDDLVEGREVDPPADKGMLQQRLDLGGEEEGAVTPDVVERGDAGGIACQQQPVAPGVVQGQRELAVEPVEEAGPFLLVEMHQHLHIHLRAEAVAFAAQLFPQILVIVDFAVADQGDRAVLVMDRLVAAGEVDDGQPAEAEA